jgi:hypothetical protein
MPPKKKVKRKGAKRKTRSVPAQKQSQKQVVNINIAKPAKRKKRRKAPVKQTAPYIPSISTMNMLSSDTARFDTLYNRLYDLQNTGTPRNPPTATPTATQIGVSGVSPQVAPFSTPLVEPAAAPVVKELPKAQAVEIVNPSLIDSATSIYNMFDEIMGTSNQPTAQVRPSPPPPQAPPLEATTPPIQDLFNQPLEDELLADLTSFNKSKLNETGEQADLINKTRPFSRVGEIGTKQNPTLAQVKKMMREEAEERAEGYETSAKTTAQPLAAGGMDIMNDISQLQGLSGILSMNAIDNVMSNLNDAQMMINPDRELPNPFNLRGDEDLGSGGGAEDIVIPKPPRKDKGKKRGQQNKTKEKILMGMEDELSRYNESIDWSGDSIAL